LLSTQVSQIGVFSLHWSQFLRQLPRGTKMPLLETFVVAEPLLPSQKSTFIQQLEAAAIETRQELLIAHLREHIAKILGIKTPEQIGLRERLFDLGIDSLMAVELKNIIESSLGCSVRSTVLFDYPTLEALVNYLQNDVLSLKFTLPEEKIEVENDSSDRFQDMTQNDLAKLLSERLAALGNKNIEDFSEEEDDS
jgi:acyl carrier protein